MSAYSEDQEKQTDTFDYHNRGESVHLTDGRGNIVGVAYPPEGSTDHKVTEAEALTSDLVEAERNWQRLRTKTAEARDVLRNAEESERAAFVRTEKAYAAVIDAFCKRYHPDVLKDTDIQVPTESEGNW